MTTGIIVFAHGSRVEPANQAVRSVAAEEAADLLISRGVRQIVVIPYFLTPGTHLERDLPVLIQNISSKNKHIQVLVTPSLDGHPGLVGILADRARGALVEPRTLK